MDLKGSKVIWCISLCIWTGSVMGQVDFEKHFANCAVEGSITIYDYQQRKWWYSDSSSSHFKTLPASTFKMIHTLIALEEGVVSGIDEVYKWDGEVRTFAGTPIDRWNRDADLEAAFRHSIVWYYVELAQQIRHKTYDTYLTSCGFSPLKISEPEGVDFWNYGEYGVSPVEQIDFLISLYEGTLPFDSNYQKTLKQLMITEATDTRILRGKTGWTKNDGMDIGWWVGYVESDGRVIFFATRLMHRSDERPGDFGGCRKTVTESVLSELGFSK